MELRKEFNLGKCQGIFKRVILSCIALLFMTSLFGSSSYFISPYVMSKWYFSIYPLATLLILFCIVGLCYNGNGFGCLFIIKEVFGIVLILCLLLSVYGCLRYWGLLHENRIFQMNAGYDNPAGLAVCLCAGFPLTIYFLEAGEKWISVVAIVTGIILIIALFLAGSRAAIFSLALVALVWIWQKRKIKKDIIWIGLLGVGILSLLTLLYLWNTQSANGRLLIWIVTLSMATQKPLFGYGWGGFKREYMNYQADFFRQHPNSSFASLADNTHHAFNEYLHLVVNFGIVGFLVFLTVVYLLFKWYLNHRNPKSDTAFLILITIGSFSLFSYPFRYPFVWEMMILAVYVILRELKLEIPHHWGMKLVYVGVIILSLLGVYHFTEQMKAKILWHKTTTLNLHKNPDSIYKNYRSLWPELKNNYLFLYNVSATLNRMGAYEKSQKISQLANRKCADYNLRLVMADDYFEMKNYKKALECYTIASNMCPVRFFPLYRSFVIYKNTGKERKSEILAKTISDKPVKIKSFIIHKMKKEVNDYLQKE